MKKTGLTLGFSGLGLVGALIVLAIVLLLAARAWSEVAPEALDVSSASPDDVLDTAPEGSAPTPGHLPDMNEMRDATERHQQSVQDTLRQIDEQPQKAD